MYAIIVVIFTAVVVLELTGLTFCQGLMAKVYRPGRGKTVNPRPLNGENQPDPVSSSGSVYRARSRYNHTVVLLRRRPMSAAYKVISVMTYLT